MVVYRISKENYIKDLTGIGAKSVGGRWNFKGIGVLYASSTISLCMLECLAHFPVAFAPKDMALAKIEVPDNSIQIIDVNDLPENWQDVPSPKILKEIAYKWIKEQKYLILKVPSIIVPQEYNYIINPTHPEFENVKLKAVDAFCFDGRVL